MKRMIFLITLLFTTTASATTFKVDGPCDVYYSPNGGAADAIVSMINKSKRTVHVLAYSFTSKPIADALIAAKGRGVDVKIVLDKGQPNAKGGQMQYVMTAGIPVWVD
jgi:phosphatidylserine/phosphatidylglycerophosphate/cardiolipin synthase-like enzyme